MKKENIEIISKTFLDGHKKSKVLYCLEEGEERYYSLLGEGCGINILHCCVMGNKHKENFWEKVFAYKIVPKNETTELIEKATGKDYISVQFFELG